MRNSTIATIVAACVLAGCATNPLIPINAPGLAINPTRNGEPIPDPGQPMSLSQARGFTLGVRAEYREQMRKQIDESQMLNSGLLVLGATVIGLAAGGANTNIILGTSLAGGTAYALGSMNLDKRRLLVLSAGIRALDCANSAVLPLDVGTERRDQLVTATKDLRAAIIKVRDDRAAVQRLLDKVSALKEAEIEAAAALKSTDTALAEANRSLRAAEKLTNDIDDAGKRLQQTVLEITQKVDAAMADTLVDISAIPQLVAGLGGFASAFAPGAGIDKLFEAKLGQATTVAKANSTSPDLGDKMAALKSSAAELQRRVDEVNALIAGVDGSAVVTALKACDVAGVAFALEVEPATLAFTAKTAASRGFAISGGTKPYTVRALDAFPDALSITFDGGLADLAQVRLSAADVGAGTFHVLVSDASNPRRNQQVEVTIAAAGGKAGSGGGSDTSAPQATLEELRQALERKKTAKQGGVTLGVDAATTSADGTRIELAVSCDPPVKNPPLSAADVRSRLLAIEGVAPIRDKLKAQGLLDAKNSQLTLHPANPNCFKAG